MGGVESACLYAKYDTKKRHLDHLILTKEIMGTTVYEVIKEEKVSNEIKEMDTVEDEQEDISAELPISIYMTHKFQTKAYLVFNITGETPQVFPLNGKTYESASCICNETKDNSSGYITKYGLQEPDDYSITVAIPFENKVVRTTVHVGKEPIIVIPCRSIYTPLLDGGFVHDVIAILSYTGTKLQKDNLLRIVICGTKSPVVICNRIVNIEEYITNDL